MAMKARDRVRTVRARLSRVDSTLAWLRESCGTAPRWRRRRRDRVKSGRTTAKAGALLHEKAREDLSLARIAAVAGITLAC